MDRVTDIIRASAASGLAAVDTITLDSHARARRRIAMTSDSGRSFLLDLPAATVLADGDLLPLPLGAIRVKAMPEPLMEVTAPDALALARLAWHLGNRHTPAEITQAAIYVAPDHVLAAMLEGLGGSVRAVVRPFSPEGGAYAGHSHGHLAAEEL